jgi:hypothetical protein
MSTPSSSDANAVEWERLVGKAILRFGDIELVSVKCLQVFPADKIGVSASRLGFSQRTDLLIEILESRPQRSAHLETLLVGFKRAKKLSEKRNLIAHNPVMLSLYVNEDETESFAQNSITSARSGAQTLDLAELKGFAAEVESLSSELWMSFLNAAGTSEHLWKTQAKKK